LGAQNFNGEMPEWSNGAVSKTVDRFCDPGVRIPLSPQIQINPGLVPGFLFQAEPLNTYIHKGKDEIKRRFAEKENRIDLDLLDFKPGITNRTK
jgi:hypothetical protein